MNRKNYLCLNDRRCLLPLLLPLLALLLWPTLAFAQDKSGVKPQVISLPSGPGSLEGLGENFEPDLSTGTSSYPVNFTVAPGRIGFQPELALNYNGGNANGPWGMGWDLNIPTVQRRTEEGRVESPHAPIHRAEKLDERRGARLFWAQSLNRHRLKFELPADRFGHPFRPQKLRDRHSVEALSRHIVHP